MQICRCYSFCNAGAARRNASTSLVFTFYLFKYLGFAGARFAAPLPRSLWRSPASFKENHFIFSWRLYSPSAVCLQPPNSASTPLRSFSKQPLVAQLPENWDWLFKSECARYRFVRRVDNLPANFCDRLDSTLCSERLTVVVSKSKEKYHLKGSFIDKV